MMEKYNRERGGEWVAVKMFRRVPCERQEGPLRLKIKVDL